MIDLETWVWVAISNIFKCLQNYHGLNVLNVAKTTKIALAIILEDQVKNGNPRNKRLFNSRLS